MKAVIVAAGVLLLSGCESLSLRNVEVKADISERFAGDFTYRNTGGPSFGGGHLFTAEIAEVVPMPNGFEARFGLRHESLIGEKDEANRRVFAGLTWRPFK